MLVQILKILSCVFLLIFLLGCYEDVEGCLDVNAANYDLDADLQCPDGCCEFPELSISVRHLHGGISLDRDNFYLDGAGNAYRINQLRYYFSEVQFLNTAGDSIEPQSELDIGLVPSLGDTVFNIVNDNLALIRLGTTSATDLGTFRTETAVVGLVLQLGVADALQIAAPSTAPSNHPLAFQDGRMHYGLDTGYVQFKLEYSLVEGGDTISREVNAFGNQPFFLDFGAPTLLPRGFDVAVTCEADVDVLLADVNLADNEAAIVELMAERFPLIFRLVAE